MKNNYLLLHGSFSSPFSNWLPWLRKELENRQLTVYTPVYQVVLDFKIMRIGKR